MSQDYVNFAMMSAMLILETCIALRDLDEFYVEKILAHHADISRLKTLAFHVKWRGFDESFNSWEPWKNLRETEMLHRYLIIHGLQKLIPAKLREQYPELAGDVVGVDSRMWRLMKERRWSYA